MTKLSALLARVLEVPEGTIGDHTSPENTPAWDSFNGLMLVSELESAYGVKFTMDEITTVRNVADIKAALRRHGADLDG